MAVQVKDKVEPEEADVDRYVGLEHIDPESLKIRRWGEPSDVESSKILFRSGDIIFGKRRAYQRKLAVADFDGICSAHAMVLRPKTNVILEEFLPFFMQSDIFMDRAVKISVGGLSPTINWRDLAKEEFALPSLEEQRRIAEVLQATDRAENACYEAEDTLSVLLQRLIDDLMPSITTIGPKTARLDDLADIQMGYAFKSDEYCEDGIQVLRIGNLYQAQFDPERDPVFLPKPYAAEYQEYLVGPGDMVMSLTGGTQTKNLGHVVVIPDGSPAMLLNQRVVKIVPRASDLSNWVFLSMKTSVFHRQFRRTLTATAQANVSKGDLASIMVGEPDHLRLPQLKELLSKIHMTDTDLASRKERLHSIQASLLKMALIPGGPE
ncbi:restriction endonuclease subunit S [bacterium]|nr:restriction endonuclease subunit S [bacterium]